VKKSRFLMILMMILPWFSLPLLGRNSIKKFLPSTIFICIIVKITNIIAKKRNWWVFYSSIHPKISGDIPFIIGPYFISSLWILKMTFGRYPLYFITNIIVHFLFAFPGMKLLKRLGIVSYVRISPSQLVAILEFRALLLYGSQLLIKKINPLKKFKLSYKKIFH
jgi:hypothetical protein